MSVSNAPSALSSAEARRPITRTNIILLGVLLVQIAIVAFVFWPRASTTTGGGALLTGITADAVTAITITDDNNRSVSFTQNADDWVLANTDGYPANAEKISQTLTKLLNINTDRLVTRTSNSHSRLQVADDDFLRKITLSTADGEQTLYLGSSTGASATHVRAAGEDATYLTNEVATWEMDTLATTWIDVTYYQVQKDAINSVTLQNANGTFAFVRNGEEWTLADAEADEPIASANISTLIDRITTLNLHTVLGKSESPDYGLATPLATIIVTSTESTADNTATGVTTDTVDTVSSESSEPQTTTLVVGAKDEETDTYYLKSSGSEFYVRLAAFTGDEFVNKQRADFYVQPEAAPDANAPANAPVNDPAVNTSPVITETATITDEVATEPETSVQGTEEITATEEITTTEEVTATDVITTEESTEEATTEEATVDASEALTTTLTPEASSTITN